MEASLHSLVKCECLFFLNTPTNISRLVKRLSSGKVIDNHSIVACILTLSVGV